MKDFFISYTGSDADIAEWIAWQLEEAGYSTVIQKWDFRPGSNFGIEMHDALTATERTIAVLSEEYMQSLYAKSEWVAAFIDDPVGSAKKLIPVKVKECQPNGLIKGVVHINMMGLDEGSAKEALLNGVIVGRAKPLHPPQYPGERSVPEKPSFPLNEVGGQVYVPRIDQPRTDLEKSEYTEQCYQTVRGYFGKAVSALMKSYPDITVRINDISNEQFICEAFKAGQSTDRCKIWLDRSSYSPLASINYSQGNISDNDFNESLSVNEKQGELCLQAMMRFGFGIDLDDNMDLDRLSPEQASEYLWRKFVLHLERVTR